MGTLNGPPLYGTLGQRVAYPNSAEGPSGSAHCRLEQSLRLVGLAVKRSA
jgi:hypothetical protein